MMNVYVFGNGSVHPIPNSESWEKDHLFNMIYVPNDTHAHKLFGITKPDVIFTVGVKCEDFAVIYGMPLYVRKRWRHATSVEDIQAWQINGVLTHAIGDSVGPKISVFTTAFESGDKILRPFHSLLQQTYSEWEWVIIDDSKTSDTWDTHLMEIAEKDCRVRLLRGRCNDGFIGSVKRDAAMMCRGQYLVELDHDDELLPTALYKIMRAFESDPTVGLLGSDCIELFENTEANWEYGSYYGFGFHSYYKQWYQGRWVNVARNGPLNKYTLRHIVGVYNHVRACRASVYYELGGHDWNLNVADDYDLILRTFISKHRIARLPEFLYKQFRNAGGNNFTFKRNAYIQKMVKVVRNRHEEAIHRRLLEIHPNVLDDLYQKDFAAPKTNSYLHWQYDPTADVVLDPAPDRISIVISTFNRHDLLIRAIKSVLAQTFTKWVLYIIGDKCPVLDDVMNKNGWAHNDRIRYWNLQVSAKDGAPPRNYASKHLVTTKEIAYLDDDNEWQPNHLETLHNALHADEKTMFAFSSFIVEQTGVKIICSAPKRYRIDTSCLLHKTELFERHGYWRTQKDSGYANDWDIVSRWVRVDEPWAATQLPTMIYNNSNGHQDMDVIYTAYDDQPDPVAPEAEEKNLLPILQTNDVVQDKIKSLPTDFRKVIAEEPVSIVRYPAFPAATTQSHTIDLHFVAAVESMQAEVAEIVAAVESMQAEVTEQEAVETEDLCDDFAKEVIIHSPRGPTIEDIE